jgi:hypothetical protein
MRIHLVTAGFSSANGQGLLAPLIRLRRQLAAAGVEIVLFDAANEEAAACDVLAIESRALRSRWQDGSAQRTLESAARRNPQIAYFDIQDSTGTLQPQALPFVRRYFKNQLLRDRSLYCEPHYGGRLFTDFAHRHFGIVDREELRSEPVADAADLAKLSVGWNAGFADYGPGGILCREIYRRVPLSPLIRRPSGFADPAAPRPVGLGFRMTRRYARETVAFQRIETARRLGIGDEPRLGRGAFMRELARTRVVVSPFGWGEINLRDYEACIAGAAIVKPDMSHLETWPDLFVAGATYLPYRWDFSDLADVVDRARRNEASTRAIAARAQALYRSAVASDEGDKTFCERFISLMRAVLPGAPPASEATARH